LKTNILRKTLTFVWCLAALIGPGPAAAFDVADSEGKKHRLADYKGRWVVVNFWATWCVPCIQEIPEIAAFAKARPDVVVLGVAMDAEDTEKVKRFAAKTGHAYPLVLADAKVEKQLGEPRALPVTRIYDPQGKVVYDRIGRVDKKMLEASTPRAAAATRS
jgi:thiol-disulfide isomerase/thioredoxin